MAGGAPGWATLHDRFPQGTSDSPLRWPQVRNTLPARTEAPLSPQPRGLVQMTGARARAGSCWPYSCQQQAWREGHVLGLHSHSPH